MKTKFFNHKLKAVTAMTLALLLGAALFTNLIVSTSRAAMTTPGAAAAMAGSTIVGWGYNRYGQVDIPAGLSGVTAIAVGWNHNLALKSVPVAEQVTQVITQVQDLVNAGSLSPGQGAGLITKLNAVIAKHNGGQTGAACNQLNAFINQVNGFIGAGALSPEQGQSLIDAANNIKANIGC
jgi:hypothetical protein